MEINVYVLCRNCAHKFVQLYWLSSRPKEIFRTIRYCIPRMWLTPGRVSGRTNSAPIPSSRRMNVMKRKSDPIGKQTMNRGIILFQEDTACTRLECCRHLHKLCLHNPCPQRWGPITFFWQAGRRSLPSGWLCSTQKRGRRVKSWPDDTHKHTHSTVIWICDLCHKQINKKHTSIRCNYSHNTYRGHPKCTLIKQRQYKPDWRCISFTHPHKT